MTCILTSPAWEPALLGRLSPIECDAKMQVRSVVLVYHVFGRTVFKPMAARLIKAHPSKLLMCTYELQHLTSGAPQWA